MDRKEQNGQVRFDQVSWTITRNDEAQRWQDVLDVLNSGDMPPKMPTSLRVKELSRTLDVLTGALLQARRRLTDHGGEIKMRRLNRREYSATIRDCSASMSPWMTFPKMVRSPVLIPSARSSFLIRAL